MAITLVVYLPTLRIYFHGDDFVAFVDLVSRQPVDHLWRVLTFSDYNFYWRPLAQAYYLLLHQLFGLDPVAFHAANLAIYLLTVWCVYLFCLRARLTRPVALLAALLFALTPAHVVSVAWVTNGGRLLALLFVLGSLLVVQRALLTRSLIDEVGAWLLFLAAALSDETVIALAPVLVLYPLAVGGPPRFGPSLTRGAAYGALCAIFIPLQMFFTLDDEPRLSQYNLGWHAMNQMWALLSRLALPIDQGGLMSTAYYEIPGREWAAGAVLGALLGLCLVLGSRQLRLLALWVVLGLLPFTLWDIPVISGRYVYYAVAPFSIILAWIAVGIPSWLRRHAPAVSLPSWALVSITSCLVLVAFAGMTSQRHVDWSHETEPYRVLAEGLPRALPELPDGGKRLIIYYSIWGGWEFWPTSVVRTIYARPDLPVVAVPRGLVDSPWPRRERGDIAVYYTNDGFLLAAFAR